MKKILLILLSFISNNKKNFLIIVILLFIAILLKSLFWKSPEEKLQEVVIEYNNMRKEITMKAESKISVERNEINKFENHISLIKSRIKVYEKCINENDKNTNSITPPIDCSEIDLSKKEELWWRTNSHWMSQSYIELTWKSYKDRAIQLLDMHTKTRWTYYIWERLWQKYNIDPVLAIAIAKADSSLWNELKSNNNIWNVWNNDRWNVVSYMTLEKGIEAIYEVLNNRYLKPIYNVWYLSQWGRNVLKKTTWKSIPNCWDTWTYCYATSKETWNINVLNTMSLIYWKEITEDYKFRL